MASELKKPLASAEGNVASKSMFSSEYVPGNALIFTPLIDLQQWRHKFSESLKKTDPSGILSKIPDDIVADLKQSCNLSHLYARSAASAGGGSSLLYPANLDAVSASVRLPNLVGNNLPPGALEPTPQESTLRSVLLFREELKRRAAQMRSSSVKSTQQQQKEKKNEDEDEDEDDEDKSKQDTTSADGKNKEIPKEKVMFGPHHHPPDVKGDRASSDEIVITVRVYRPFMQHRNYRTCLLGEYKLLGCHTLAHLRDIIVCEFDYASLAGDLSDKPSAIAHGLPIAKDRYPSAFFFINDTCYDDMRHPEAKRLSQVVIDQAKAHGHASLHRADFDMADAKVGDLVLKLGYPYLFVHQGNCEHLVVFTDVRLFNQSSDCSLVACYPVVLQRRHHFRRPCMCCWRIGAKWAVSNCLLCPEDPTLLCGCCADRLLYDDCSGKKMSDAGPFKLYALPSVCLGFPAGAVSKGNTWQASVPELTESDRRDLLDLPMPRDNDDLINSDEAEDDDDDEMMMEGGIFGIGMTEQQQQEQIEEEEETEENAGEKTA